MKNKTDETDEVPSFETLTVRQSDVELPGSDISLLSIFLSLSLILPLSWGKFSEPLPFILSFLCHHVIGDNTVK